jgi:hypothetical protein
MNSRPPGRPGLPGGRDEGRVEINRDLIISACRQSLEPEPDVLALWLEGADATGFLDAYSDLDLNCSVRAGAMPACLGRARAALQSLGRLDIDVSRDEGPDHLSATFHLAGSSPFLLVDFDLFVGRGSDFIADDPIEKPLVLFDKAGVVTFRPAAEALARPGLAPAARWQALQGMVSQSARLEKYLRRGEFLEAFGYYQRWLLRPLIEALRLRYTPLHPDYDLVHISRHLPAEALQRLEDLFKVHSLAELETKCQLAQAFFSETVAFLQSPSPTHQT